MNLRKKLLKRFAVVATASILLTAVFMTAAFWFVFSEQASAYLTMLAQTIAKTYDIDNVKSLEGIIADENVRITLIAPDGNVLYDSESDTLSMPNHNDRPEFQDALKKGTGSMFCVWLKPTAALLAYSLKSCP